MRDKNGKILKMWDRIKNEKGVVFRLENICGVTMARDMKTGRCTVMRKINMDEMEFTYDNNQEYKKKDAE